MRRTSVLGLGSIALSSLMARCGFAGSSARSGEAAPFKLGKATARRVILIFAAGGLSQLDLFDEKPLLGHPDSCPMDHTGYSLGGHLVVRMVASGVETHIRRGDFFTIPAGHDGYVEGAEPVELILFAAPTH